MSESEYMKNVRWTTAIYICCSAGSILLALAGMYFGLKGDIKENRVTSHEELTYAVVSINRKQDSIQHVNDIKFNDIWYFLKSADKPIKETTVRAVTARRRADGSIEWIRED